MSKDSNIQGPSPSESPDTSRRQFLKVTALGSAGFMIGLAGPNPGALASGQAVDETAVMNDFVKVSANNTITVVVKHLEKGQGVTTGLSAIVAEEMDADWSQIDTEFAPADASRYRNLMFSTKQGTGGSTSLANSWMQLRQAGAGARAVLVAAAAKRWNVATSAISVKSGRVSSGDHSASFGELAAAAGEIEAPAEVSLKDPSDFQLIGTNLPRKDSPSKTDGSAQFGIDLTRPGMKIAVVARPPKFGGQLKSVDSSKALEVDGVSAVVEIPRGVAVLADSYFSALRGRDALVLQWDDSNAENRGTTEFESEYTALLNEKGSTSRNDGDISKAFPTAAKVVDAQFMFPFLAHGAMEPLNCVIELSPQRCEVWTGSQQPSVDQTRVAEITGLDAKQIFIHTVIAGGSFGRRSPPDCDFIAEAAMIAVAVKGQYPVKLQWSREDDMRGGRYRPMAAHRMRAAISSNNELIGWDQRVVSQSILKGTTAERFVRNGIDPTAIEGSQHLPYAIDNFHLDLHLVPSGVPILWWRSVGHSHNAFATEVFFDMAANACGKDPYEMRRDLLTGHDRLLGVLNLAAKAADWSKPLGQGRGRGIALHKSFNSYVAQVAEVSVSDKGELAVDRVVCAIDCGLAVTPDVIRAQMEGSIGYGLSAALREQITLTQGEVDQSNFHNYPPLRISEMPDIEVHIVKSAEPPSGVGEPGLPPIAPAVANAIGDATGTYLTRLPFADQLS